MTSNVFENSGFVPDNFTIGIKSTKDVHIVELSTHSPKNKATDYDPYKHRTVEHPTTNFETFIHLIKGALGTGIFAIPSAFNHAGWTIGLIGTIILGTICTHCVHILIQTEYFLCRKNKVPCMNFAQVAETALAEGPKPFKCLSSYMSHIINIFLIAYLLGTCCVYVIFVSFNIKDLVDYFLGYSIDLRIYMCIILIPLIGINCVRSLKFYAPFSTAGNLIITISFGIIAYYILKDPLTLSDKPAFGSISEFPLFFGTVLFALEAIYVILPLENEMATPQNFGGPCGVLNISMIMVVLLYMVMGFFGNMKYGSEIQGSITLNLPHDEILAQSIKALLALAIFFTHGLACYVATDVTWTDYIKKRFAESPNELTYEYITKIVHVLITFILAVLIPNLEILISLVGALCLSALGIAFPAIIETCAYWNHVSGLKKAWLLTKNGVIVLIALIGLVSGLYTTILELIH